MWVSAKPAGQSSVSGRGQQTSANLDTIDIFNLDPKSWDLFLFEILLKIDFNKIVDKNMQTTITEILRWRNIEHLQI